MSKKSLSAAGATPTALPAGYACIHGGIVELLDAAHQAAARSVNALMTASYWEIGRRIVEAEQQGKRRAGYGEQLMTRLSADLTMQFGRGFGVNNLENMRRCIDPAEPAQVRPLMRMPQRVFSCSAPGAGADGCRSGSSPRSGDWHAAAIRSGADARIVP